jgi:hypothetical protein
MLANISGKKMRRRRITTITKTASAPSESVVDEKIAL